LATSKGKRKRSRTMTIMLLPALIVIFIIGWFMYCMGDQKRTDKIQRKPPKQHKSPEKDYVTIMPIVFEEPQENA
jgi:heme/copper-type cytochrome/quinol oxidase subunit 2